MENYGLIIYRENELLYDEFLSTASKKQRVSFIETVIGSQTFLKISRIKCFGHTHAKS